jgi:hypothetical protein
MSFYSNKNLLAPKTEHYVHYDPLPPSQAGGPEKFYPNAGNLGAGQYGNTREYLPSFNSMNYTMLNTYPPRPAFTNPRDWFLNTYSQIYPMPYDIGWLYHKKNE